MTVGAWARADGTRLKPEEYVALIDKNDLEAGMVKKRHRVAAYRLREASPDP